MFLEEDYPISISTSRNGEWIEDTVFDTKDDFNTFVLSKFKEPGKCGFTSNVKHWQEQSLSFIKNGYYCKHPSGTRDFIKYWDFEKKKSTSGAIFIDENGESWYIQRVYYFWLNFLPIYHKDKKLYSVPDIYDIQYYLSLYELLAELNNKHAAILKKRQIASSYYHVALMINAYWFDQGAKLKMGASLKDYINVKGSWKIANEYSDFLNEHTAWIRAHNPGSVGDWEQKIKIRVEGRDITKGRLSTFTSHTFDKDATSGVGGPCRYFFHEEAGVAPKLDLTYEFMRPALYSGMILTGQFIAAGSVGDLSQCEPLKKFILEPEENDFYSVTTNLMDDKGTIGTHGLFLPEQWSMKPFIDEYGNSQVEKSLEAIKEQRADWRLKLDPSIYRLRVSQKPTNIKEAFDFREEAVFPLEYLTKQQDRIDNKEYHYERIKLDEAQGGKIKPSISNRSVIDQFPIDKKRTDKEGVLQVWERPIDNNEWGTYYASIDPVAEGKTTTSLSLCSIYIYKNTLEIERNEAGEVIRHIEPGRIVAAWCGRYDDINDTHKQLEKIVRWYNAWTLVENNISHFIQYMISKKLQKYLVPKDQILFLKNLGVNTSVYQEYGWKNTGTTFKNHMISYTIEFLKEKIDQEFDKDGVVKSTKYGVERIPDPMLLQEMSKYRVGLNVDRLVSFAALVSFIKIQESNRGYKKRKEVDENLHKSSDLYNFKKGLFKNRRSNRGGSAKRSPFKNIR